MLPLIELVESPVGGCPARHRAPHEWWQPVRLIWGCGCESRDLTVVLNTRQRWAKFLASVGDQVVQSDLSITSSVKRLLTGRVALWIAPEDLWDHRDLLAVALGRGG